MAYELSKYTKHNEQLSEQLSFASALNRIAETMISYDNITNILETMVAIIGSTLNVDRSLIYKVDFAEWQIFDQCEWLNPHTPNIISFRDTYNLDVFIDGCTFMKKHRTWLETHVDNYGSCFLRDGSGDVLHKYMNIKSALYYPFSFHEQEYYCLTFDQVNQCRTWRKEEINFIASVANLVEIALQKINFLAEQRNHEKALRLSEERFYKVFHYSPVALTLSHLDGGKFIDANECCLKMHGYSLDEFIEHTSSELNLWADMDERAKFFKELKENGFTYNHEIKSYKKNGELFDALFSGVVIDLNGENYILGTKSNITELKQYQREISRLNSLNMIGEMAAGIAHEIRNPMTTVKGFLQLLSNKKEHKNLVTILP